MNAPQEGACVGPLVSAIITTYNYARFLPDALESVLGQTYSHLEIVLVDDGSTDATPTVARRYADRGVRYVARTHAGAGAARNTGLQMTSAPLIAFLDGDDAWLPDRVARGVAFLVRHPEVALVAGHAFACDEHLEPRAVVYAGRREAGDAFESLLIDNVVLNPSSVLVRRSALTAAGGFSVIPVGQDWDTWLEVAKRFPIGFIDGAVALVRRHGDSLSPTDPRHRIDINREILERHLPDLRPAWRRPLVRRRSVSSAYFHAGLSSAQRGDRRRASRYAMRAAALDPVTLARRKATLVFRTWVPDRLTRRLRRAVRYDERRAAEIDRLGGRSARA